MKPQVVGLIGKVCAGKSTVSQTLRDHGGYVYNADKAVHLMYDDEDVKKAVLDKFGLGVFKDTKVDRAALGDVVFPSPDRMKDLTDIIYPRIEAQIRELVDSFRKTHQELLVLDVPLLLKAGLDHYCDRLVYVTAEDSRRIAWAAANRNWTPENLLRRDALLDGPVVRKHEVIHNSGDKAELQAKVDKMVERWQKEEADAAKKWRVMRQDDCGNEFIVKPLLDRKSADALRSALEVKGYKQMYYVEEDA